MIKDILSKWPFAKLRIKNRDKYDQGHSFKMPLLVYAKLRTKIETNMIKDIVSKCPFEFMLNYETTFVSDDYQRRETYKEQSSSKLEALYMSPSSGHSVALFPLPSKRNVV